jgi:glycosyltransferase involved in cell wall biosynthesis
MACGVPVIGSSSGEIPNVIGGSGLVFEEGNPQALAVGLQRIFADHHLRIELSSSGIERVMSTYAVPVVARQYHSLFMNLANARE